MMSCSKEALVQDCPCALIILVVLSGLCWVLSLSQDLLTVAHRAILFAPSFGKCAYEHSVYVDIFTINAMPEGVIQGPDLV